MFKDIIFNYVCRKTGTFGVVKRLATPDGLAGVLILGDCISLFTPASLGVAGDFAFFLNSSLTPCRFTLRLADCLPVESGDTSISPGPFGVSGMSAYSTESGVERTVEAGVPWVEAGDFVGGVVNSSPRPLKLVLPMDFFPLKHNTTKSIKELTST